jgi:uncharacterized OB-fold protein
VFGPEMPRPEPDALTAAFWAACREHRLVIQRCRACGTFRHLPHVLCGRCQSPSHEWVASAGRGTVFTYTIVGHSVHPATDHAVPYAVAVVALDDCGRVLVTSNVIGCDPQDVHVGMAVEVAWEDLDDGLSLYRFTPV